MCISFHLGKGDSKSKSDQAHLISSMVLTFKSYHCPGLGNLFSEISEYWDIIFHIYGRIGADVSAFDSLFRVSIDSEFIQLSNHFPSFWI